MLLPKYDRTYTPLNEFHAVVTAELGELYKDGFIDFSDESWKWDFYNEEQYNRLNKKILDRFWHREISILPPGAWKREFLRTLNEIMPKYKILYERIEKGINPFQKEDKYGKHRTIISEFPETMLSDNEDYASNGNDREFETTIEGDVINKIKDFKNFYRDVDVLILEELEKLFSQLISVSVNSLY